MNRPGDLLTEWLNACQSLPKHFSLNLAYNPDREVNQRFSALAEANEAAPDGVYPIFYAEGETPSRALSNLSSHFHHDPHEETH